MPYEITSHAIKGAWPHLEIPPLPFRMLVVGPSGTGKSCIISSMLGFEPYQKAWKQNTFIFSPTMRDDPEYSHLKVKPENVFDSYNAEVIMSLYESQRTAKQYLKKDRELEHICIVLDDLIADLPMNQRSLLSKLFMTGRHLNISIIIASQSYKLCTRTIRMNLTCLVCLHCNAGEVGKIAEESAASNFEALHEIGTREPHGFVVEIVGCPLAERFRKRFTLDFLPAC